MDDIREVVNEIVKQCASRGVSVPEVLAALVARTVIDSSASGDDPTFRLSSTLTGDGISALVDRSVEVLLQSDSPSLETMKMQVAFDSSYIKEEDFVTSHYARREARLKEMQRSIISLRPRDAADFDALTALHRKIFNHLLRHAHEGSEIDRSVEREVAAALESVFPRISLKAFVGLSPQEKHAQLDELASIVLGIRLFNKYIGKGGANLPDAEQELEQLLTKMSTGIASEVESVQVLCQCLQDTVVHVHVRQPQGVTPELLDRWKDELANRRQFLSYLLSLQEDVAVSERKVAALREKLATETADLEQLVGNRASIPKEHVYPKFDAIAVHWLMLFRELKVLRGTTRTLDVLGGFKESYTATLTPDLEIVQAVREVTVPSLEEEANAAQAALSAVELGEHAGEEAGEQAGAGADGNQGGPAGITQDEPAAKGPAAEGVAPVHTTGSEGEVAAPVPGDGDPSDVQAEGRVMEEGERRSVPERLSIESTPEFMQLPLEHQGFCPWTIVNRRGLLLPGRPELDVVCYKGSYYVFAHMVAINAFMDDPERFIAGVQKRAMLSPELIHLLRLQDKFPETSITGMLRGEDGKARQGSTFAPPERQDAATGTPVHFVEKHIDSQYHWNEWVLRRRILQIANLRQCKTTSQQTDESHFRRENDTQIYLPTVKQTQTAISSGTKPPYCVRYLAGLRGTPVDHPSVSKYVAKHETVDT
ncbi:unnamed protein product, partial [Chrysoparadoxa australica]